ncbi:hypothetical protein A4A49_24977 [Nicotiana attenuata]|uniref:Sn1-specific diacylglycerol lipase alpha n=1 Tax=Nicotiana attenuata TaxID=49451 RepID=A0A1J6L3J3_NICAT|nr:hypothetical protein A4A49_24977 [Nicotiana attenuata]
MATATIATAAGAAALLYYTLNKKLQSAPTTDDDEEECGSSSQDHAQLGINRVSNRLIQAPATWLETIATLSETLRFTYSETLGKWPIGDLAFGISFLLKQQGNIHISSIFCGEDSTQLQGSDIVAELKFLLHLLTVCWHFSKKPFPLFLEETGYSQESVLLQEPKAGILKPAFTILADHRSKSFFLVIRGTHSIKDTLTAATGAVVPFHHTMVHEGGVSNLVLGYAHCGMVAAARWIAKLATPCLLKALSIYPEYKLKIVGHSLGGGTAALLTYILREQKELSAATCVAFAPDPPDGLEKRVLFMVTASAWLNDLRNQIEHTRILSTVYRSASALGSRLPSIATARAKVAGAGAILRPVSSGTQVVMKRAQSMAQAALSRPAMQLSSWSCIGPRRRATNVQVNSDEQPNSGETSSSQNSGTFLLESEETRCTTVMELPVSSTDGITWNSEIDQSVADGINSHNGLDPDLDDSEHVADDRPEDRMTEVEMWQQLEHELYDQSEGETDVAKEIREEEAAAIAESGQSSSEGSVPNTKEVHRFFPPGKIMHIVTLLSEEEDRESDSDMLCEDHNQPKDTKVGIFLTPRSLYSKIRLSQTMISDHLMPAYRKQIEKLIRDHENDDARVRLNET